MLDVKDAFFKAIDVTWKGMLAIFIAIGIIFIAIKIMNYINKKMSKK